MQRSGSMFRWSNEDAAVEFLEEFRWSGRPICPYCNSGRTSVHASRDKTKPRWQCHSCTKAFSVTVGTMFHRSHLPLKTWFKAIDMVMASDRDVSATELQHALELPYKTAWNLKNRIIEASKGADAAFIAAIIGIPIPMHKPLRAARR